MRLNQTDQELLKLHLHGGSEEAFAELVQRHAGLVLSTARRLIPDSGVAEEVAQSVFVTLAQKGAWAQGELNLAGWLHRVTVNQSRQAIRSEVRRLQRQQEALNLGTIMQDHSERQFLDQIKPVLDESLMNLREQDRQALVLRFFESRSLKEVAAGLAIKEDAAQKRIKTALEKLARIFQRKGFALPAGLSLGSVLSCSIESASAQLVGRFCAAAFEAKASLGLGAILAGKLLGLIQSTVCITACVVVSLTPVVFQWNEWSQAQADLEEASLAIPDLAGDLAQLKKSIARLEKQKSSLQAESGRRERVKAIAQALTPSRTAVGNFRWRDDLDYVRVPKSLLKGLGYRNDPGKVVEYGIDPTPDSVLNRDGVPSEVFMKALGLADGERSEVRNFLGRFRREYEASQERRLVPTNALAVPSLPKSDFLPISSNTLMWVVQPMTPEECDSLEKSFKSGLAAVVGAERAEIFIERMKERDELRWRFDDFGKGEHFYGTNPDATTPYWLLLARTPGAEDRWWVRSIDQFWQPSFLPTALKSHLKPWPTLAPIP